MAQQPFNLKFHLSQSKCLKLFNMHGVPLELHPSLEHGSMNVSIFIPTSKYGESQFIHICDDIKLLYMEMNNIRECLTCKEVHYKEIAIHQPFECTRCIIEANYIESFPKYTITCSLCDNQCFKKNSKKIVCCNGGNLCVHCFMKVGLVCGFCRQELEVV